MAKILSYIGVLKGCLTPTILVQLGVIAAAILSITGRVTMKGIARWAGEGGSYRTIQRFFNAPIEWAKVHWTLVRHYFLVSDDIFILAGDETVVTKSGKKTHGLDRFFSSLYGKPVPGLAFFVLSLISTKRRLSMPLIIQQIIKSEDKKVSVNVITEKESKSKKKNKKGRPKGSKNKNKENVELSPYLCSIQNMIKQVQQLIGSSVSIVYFVVDGAFGHNEALQMTRQCNMHLISKLKHNSALYFQYEGTYSGRGPRNKYGDKIDYKNIPKKYLKKSSCEGLIQTDIYQMKALHKLFAQVLNVVIIVKTNLVTLESDHVILFSSDLNLLYEKLIEYYKLRFQIEFNFRDAKQYWGLEDFMNVRKLPVTNAANLAFFMVNLSHVLIAAAKNGTLFSIASIEQNNQNFGVQDLKAYFRGVRYAEEILKLLPQNPDPILIQQILGQITKIGTVNEGSMAQ
jgi:putative transposase